MSNKWLQELINLVFPQAPACLLCEKTTGKQHFMEISLPTVTKAALQKPPLVELSKHLCESCLVEMQFCDHHNICYVCGRILIAPAICIDCQSIAKKDGRYFHRARSTTTYSDKIKLMIHDYKYHGQRQLLEPLAILIFAAWEQNYLYDCELLVPVPLHIDRLAERSFNQATMLAKKIEERYRVPVAELLIRNQETEKQSKKSRQQRMEKLTGIFTISDDAINLIKGKKIVLVDDIYTTGTTADACAEVLIEHGAGQVDILTIAR